MEDWVGWDKSKVGQSGDMVVKSFAILKCQIWLKEKKYYINSDKINIWYWVSKFFSMVISFSEQNDYNSSSRFSKRIKSDVKIVL